MLCHDGAFFRQVYKTTKYFQLGDEDLTSRGPRNKYRSELYIWVQFDRKQTHHLR